MFLLSYNHHGVGKCGITMSASWRTLIHLAGLWVEKVQPLYNDRSPWSDLIVTEFEVDQAPVDVDHYWEFDATGVPRKRKVWVYDRVIFHLVRCLGSDHDASAESSMDDELVSEDE